MFNITKEEWDYIKKEFKDDNKLLQIFVIVGFILRRSIFMRFLTTFNYFSFIFYS